MNKHGVTIKSLVLNDETKIEVGLDFVTKIQGPETAWYDGASKTFYTVMVGSDVWKDIDWDAVDIIEYDV